MDPNRKAVYDPSKTADENGKAAYDAGGWQMLNNMTPKERISKGLPGYSLTDNENRRMSGQLTDTEREHMKKVQREVDEFNAKEAEKIARNTYRMNINSWGEAFTTKFREEWIKKKNMTRKQMYDQLMSNNVDPWKHILNCVAEAPPDPNNKQGNPAFNDLYYDVLVPDCGVAWEWYNTPGVDLGDPLDRARLAAKFAPSMGTEAEILTKKVIKGGKEVANDLEVPFYFSGVVVAVIAFAVIAVKVF